MPIGVIVDVPNQYSTYGRVRSEHGEEFTVHGSEISPEEEPGDNFAYHVDVWQNTHGNVATLRYGTYGPDDI